MTPRTTAGDGIIPRCMVGMLPVATGLFLLVTPISLLGQEQPKLSGHTRKVNCIQFSPDGTMLASTSYDRTLRLWDLATHKEKCIIDDPNRYAGYIMSFASDGKELTTLSYEIGTIVISYWDLTKGRHRQTTSFHVKAAALSRDRELLFSIDSASTGRIIAITTGKILLTLPDLPLVTGVAWAPDQSTIALSTTKDDEIERGVIQLRDAVTGKVVKTFRLPDGVGQMVFSPDGKTFAAYNGRPDRIFLWDLQTGKLRAQLRVTTRDELKFSPDSRLLAVNRGNLVELWDVATGKKWLHLPPEARPYTVQDLLLEQERRKRGIQLPPEQRPNPFYCLAFPPDGKTLAGGCADGSIRLLPVPERK